MGYQPPKDYLICDGSEYQIDQYSLLANLFKTEFGSINYFGGDGIKTFAVPDLRNMFLRGYHGEAEEKLTREIGKKQNATSEISPKLFGNGVIGFPVGTEGIQDFDTIKEVNSSYGYRNTGTNEGAFSLYYTSRPVNIAVLYCIKAVSSNSILEDYNTDDDWHVRKWASGYIEMNHVGEYTIPGVVKYGTMIFTNPAFLAQKLPVSIKKIERVSIDTITNAVYGFCKIASTSYSYDPLTQSPPFNIVQWGNMDDIKTGMIATCNIFIAGYYN